MGRKIQVSQAFLDSPVIAEIFRNDVGKQLYLCIGPTRLRSQHFNDAILSVAQYIEEKGKPRTVQEMRSILFCHGQRDPAVCTCFRHPESPYFYEKVAEGSNPNWESWNRKIDDTKAAYQASVDKQDALAMELVDAINGRGQWEYEVV